MRESEILRDEIGSILFELSYVKSKTKQKLLKTQLDFAKKQLILQEKKESYVES